MDDLSKTIAELNSNTCHHFSKETIVHVAQESAVKQRSFVQSAKTAFFKNGMQKEPDSDVLDMTSHANKINSNDVGEGHYKLSLVVESGRKYVVQEKNVLFGNCPSCFRAHAMGMKCISCPEGPRAVQMFFCADPTVFDPQSGESMQDVHLRVTTKLQPVCPVEMSWTVLGLSPSVQVDDKFYQGQLYCSQPTAQLHAVKSIHELLMLLENTDRCAKIGMMNLEPLILSCAKVNLKDLMSAIDQLSHTDEQRQAIMESRTFRPDE